MGVKGGFSAADEKWMRHALEMAKLGEQVGEVPVGAALVKDDQLITEAYNQPITSNDPSAHAEIIALRKAGIQQKNYRLPGTTLYVTLEPCPMCTGAMIHARVERLVFAASDPRTGAAGSAFELINDPRHNHQIKVENGLLLDEASELLRAFFKARR